jgi:hypothetical protein
MLADERPGVLTNQRASRRLFIRGQSLPSRDHLAAQHLLWGLVWRSQLRVLSAACRKQKSDHPVSKAEPSFGPCIRSAISREGFRIMI